MTDDPSDIFNRTRALIDETSIAILAAGTNSIGIERARQRLDFHNMERNCAQMGEKLAQALQMQMILMDQIKREPRGDVVDMRGVNIGRMA